MYILYPYVYDIEERGRKGKKKEMSHTITLTKNN